MEVVKYIPDILRWLCSTAPLVIKLIESLPPAKRSSEPVTVNTFIRQCRKYIHNSRLVIKSAGEVVEGCTEIKLRILARYIDAFCNDCKQVEAVYKALEPQMNTTAKRVAAIVGFSILGVLGGAVAVIGTIALAPIAVPALAVAGIAGGTAVAATGGTLITGGAVVAGTGMAGAAYNGITQRKESKKLDEVYMVLEGVKNIDECIQSLKQYQSRIAENVADGNAEYRNDTNVNLDLMREAISSAMNEFKKCEEKLNSLKPR